MTTTAGTQDGRMLRAEEPTEPLGDFEVDDPYMAWVREQGVPLIEEYAFEDLNALELSPWEPKGGSGAIINIPNRTLPNDAHVVEIAPGGKSEPVHHMYETQMYVLSGRGATSIWVDESRKQTFEWKAGSVFAIPLNAWYQLFNGSGAEPARYIAVTSAPPIMRLYRDNHFIFNLPYVFSNRYADDAFNGTGKLYNGRVWESNFIPNADNMPLYGMPLRGAGGINAQLEMAKNSITAHISEFPVGTYKKAHRHGPGAHLLITGGVGFALIWKEEDMSDLVKADWQRGSLYLPTQDSYNEYFHQHFNVGTTPARYINMSPSNSRKYTYQRGINDPSRRGEIRAMVSIKEGGIQLEYEDEDPRVHAIFEEELAKHGQQCRMKNLVGWCKTGVPGPENKKGALEDYD
jgi:mannose-6-phosphate isomerase-like protein (cupin superfamily)